MLFPSRKPSGSFSSASSRSTPNVSRSSAPTAACSPSLRARRCDLPPFPSSAMDGYAIRSADTSGGSASLAARRGDRCGKPGRPRARPAEAMAISTGGVVPDGSDAVVPLEHASERDGRVELDAQVVVGRERARARAAMSRRARRCSNRARCSALPRWVRWQRRGWARCSAPSGRASASSSPDQSSGRRGAARSRRDLRVERPHARRSAGVRRRRSGPARRRGRQRGSASNAMEKCVARFRHARDHAAARPSGRTISCVACRPSSGSRRSSGASR